MFGFAIDSHSGKLTAVPGEPIQSVSPYSLGVEPSGRFVFVGNDDGTTSAFSLQRSNGTLHEIDGSPFAIGGSQPELAFATAH
ncbi:MAG: beta-propeller fold lactonase family protein [Pseudomonadota bacterium]